MFVIYAFFILLAVYLVKSDAVKDEIKIGCFVIMAVVVILTVVFEIL